ncbi:MAG: hypothetical protein NT084_06855 [Bacteroidetes bacterium]|jgi:hypothetical protein|nr:hypothetical protein [Bacteroidota bacterium]
MKKVFFGVAIILFAMNSCAPSRYVIPLAEKQKAITANFGGPTIGFSGAIIPIPLTAVGYGYGIDSNTTVFGNFHTTSLLFGVFQTDIGVCRNLYRGKNGFGVSGNLVANLTFDKWEHNFRGWPQIDLNAYKKYNSRGSFFYAGCDNWIELSKYRAHHQPQNVHLIFNAHAGITFVHSKWNYQLEAKYLAPYVNNLPNVVDYKGISHHGAFGIYFGVYRLF